jgi:Holliday junction DNA helicase RuvA
MIGRLRGIVAEKHAEGLLLDVAGVGYEMAVPPRALVELPGLGDEAVVHTHLHVREDAMALFGFSSEDQRDLFRLLLGISGVGPKVALAILGTMTPDDLRRAVLTDDAAALTAVPGIGKRSAQKLLLELRPKLELPDTELTPSSSPLAEVRAALEGLGYQGDEIRVALAELPETDEVDQLLRRALQTLGRQA